MASKVVSEARPQPTAVTTRHDASNESLGYSVAEALAAAEGVDVTELDVRLYDSVDVDALDAMFDNRNDSDADWSLTVACGEYEVTVESTGQIAVYEKG